MKSQGNTSVVVDSIPDRRDNRRKHRAFVKLSVGVLALIILTNSMWSTMMIFNNALLQEKNSKLLAKISDHITRINIGDNSTKTSTESIIQTEGSTSRLITSSTEISLATTDSSTLTTTVPSNFTQTSTPNNATTSTTKGETILTSTLTDSNTNPMATSFSSEYTDNSTSIYHSTTNAITSSFVSTTDFTNPDLSTLNNSDVATSTIQNPDTDTSTTSSTPGKPKQRPYLMLRKLHGRLPIEHICIRYCINPPIIKSNMTIRLDIGGSTEFFEAYVSDSSPLPSLEKVSYFALEGLYPLSIEDVETPEDLSHEILVCPTSPTHTVVKCNNKNK